MGTVEQLLANVAGRYSDHPDRLLQPNILIGNIIPEILDNLPFPTQTVELQGYKPRLMDRIVPSQLREALMDITTDWQIGDAHGAIVAVGKPRSGSSHPHLFETVKGHESVRLLFVDPENTVGDRNLLKPAVMIMGAVQIPADPSLAVSLDFLRFKSSVHLIPKEMSLQSQYRDAQALTTDLGLPIVVAQHPDSIIYRLSLRPNRALLQARYATRGQIRDILEGGVGSAPLEFRLTALRETLALFPQFSTGVSPDSERYRRFIITSRKLRSFRFGVQETG